jgi:hypothetical protein
LPAILSHCACDMVGELEWGVVVVPLAVCAVCLYLTARHGAPVHFGSSTIYVVNVAYWIGLKMF